VVVEDGGLPRLFLPFAFPGARLRLASCRFLRTRSLEQARYPRSWVLLGCFRSGLRLSFGRSRAVSFLLEKVRP